MKLHLYRQANLNMYIDLVICETTRRQLFSATEDECMTSGMKFSGVSDIRKVSVVSDIQKVSGLGGPWWI